jgi:hypothetical protein
LNTGTGIEFAGLPLVEKQGLKRELPISLSISVAEPDHFDATLAAERKGIRLGLTHYGLPYTNFAQKLYIFMAAPA